ncbi:peptidase M56 BlaR1 [Crinalium epipsammum PCC 9333]|uniref:Peptidase M56 BlaR1 n=1 Tax=Crinalium epipsammum PCC 9333 TaxID=1173022 RepID=K9VY56_9CYAN|nr:M56 family metallopeptidase [Crinalium epipsammum]AFZ12452.1 peptidase M56 BlaR1 [Crinalium epipsammum PCC 9333]
MHLSIILIAVGLAMLYRVYWFRSHKTWLKRWQQTLIAFVFPPLLIIVTSLTVLCMGHHGTMLWRPVGWIGCHIALLFLVFAGITICYLFWQGWISLQKVRTYPLTTIAGKSGRVINTPELFAAQVGFWQPELVVSQGLLQSLDAEQIEAVFSHEQAHYYYRDTFWFFWLGCIRQFTFWLPKTNILWQELLLLRELRADRWAAKQVDALILAESLLLVVRSPLINTHYAGFNDTTVQTRLEERIEALLSPDLSDEAPSWLWAWLLLSLLPILTIPFHI